VGTHHRCLTIRGREISSKTPESREKRLRQTPFQRKPSEEGKEHTAGEKPPIGKMVRAMRAALAWFKQFLAQKKLGIREGGYVGDLHSRGEVTADLRLQGRRQCSNTLRCSSAKRGNLGNPRRGGHQLDAGPCYSFVKTLVLGRNAPMIETANIASRKKGGVEKN